jgi:NAD(P)-dependent dehydrogenase (short-subunit alcohol dehydrogenase family)
MAGAAAMVQAMTNGKGRTALVTGATDGVGRVVAAVLGKDGWRVLVHGRDAKRGEALVQEIAQSGGSATFLQADLLINNAGIGTAGPVAGRQTSIDGHELRFAVNYLAGFLLTHELLPLLKAAAPARIVNVSSAGQQAIDFSDVMLTRSYSGVAAYCQSKLAQIMFTIDLAEELSGTGVIANALHPSTYMNTTMVRRSGISPMSRVEDGAEAILQLAVSPKLEGRSGLYFNVLNEARANPQAYDAEARRKLRALSLELTGVKP